MATPAQRLVEAEAALHSLLTGTAVARVRDANGEEVAYSKADATKLEAYIAQLRREIANPSGALRVTGPMRPFFI